LRFLADESCDYPVVKALRASALDVAAILEESRGAPDQEAFARARRENRIEFADDVVEA